MNKLFVDLHIHTNFSDGSFSPEEVVRYAQEAGLSGIAITDHDITDGILPAIKEGVKRGIEVIPGVELSVELKNSSEGEMHILGYFINWEDVQFQEKLKLFRTTRERRAIYILEKLSQIGIKLNEEKLLNLGGRGSIGRLHIARLLLEEGYINDIREAFQKYLGFGKPAYVPKFRLKPEDAIRMIKKIGGVPVLAHPFYGNYGSRNIISGLVKFGLKGIESWHSKHPQKAKELFMNIAKEFNLVVTGGSDCHGPIGNEPPLIGTQKVPYEVLLNLKQAKFEIDKSIRHILRRTDN
ncbi:MAG: PHP domain-containing protein [Endomicrobiia bacterium]